MAAQAYRAGGRRAPRPGTALAPHTIAALGRGELPELLVRVQDDICLAAIDCMDDTRYSDPRVCLALDTCTGEPDYQLENRRG